MSSIEQAFEDGAAFMPFTVGGYPDKETSIEIVESLVESGADIVELGIPFSDPMADGPVIKEAAQEALEEDISVEDVLDIASEFSETPVVLMAYANSIRSYGYREFFRDAEESGVNGLIVPDMPPEEYEREIGDIDTDVNQIFLISQNTPKERIEMIGEKTEGFAYIVAVKGTTGARKSFSEQSSELLGRTSSLEVPCCLGFGISNSEQAETAIKAGADGVIMGSAIIETFNQEGVEGIENLAEQVSSRIREVER